MLGTADDFPATPADGAEILTFDQAQTAARSWARAQSASERAAAFQAATVTVRSAINAYTAARKARDAKAGRDAELRLGHHVSSARLASVELLALPDDDFARWRDGLRRGSGTPTDAPLAPATLVH